MQHTAAIPVYKLPVGRGFDPHPYETSGKRPSNWPELSALAI
jgi:hypothetical protein